MRRNAAQQSSPLFNLQQRQADLQPHKFPKCLYKPIFQLRTAHNLDSKFHCTAMEHLTTCPRRPQYPKRYSHDHSFMAVSAHAEREPMDVHYAWECRFVALKLIGTIPFANFLWYFIVHRMCQSQSNSRPATSCDCKRIVQAAQRPAFLSPVPQLTENVETLGVILDRLVVFTKTSEHIAQIAQRTAFPSPVPQLTRDVETLG